MKRCNSCDRHKPRTEFHRCASTRDGLQYKCVSCYKVRDKGRVRSSVEYTRAWRVAHPEYDQNRDRDWAAYYAKHKVRLNSDKRRWQRENPGKAAAATARRRAGLERATPRWLSAEDHELIRFLYEEAAALSKHTGVKFHVDHIVPLRGKTVSGLHVPWNLRVIAASKNISKQNKFVG